MSDHAVPGQPGQPGHPGHLGDSVLLVWVEGWEHECCGVPFAVGDLVVWGLGEIDSSWTKGLDRTLGPEVARTVTHYEGHHVDPPPDHPRTSGRVRRIRGQEARWQWSWAEGRQTRTLVEGSRSLRDLDRAEKFHPRLQQDWEFAGYLVDLEPLDERQVRARMPGGDG